jgi:hypothetical protein
MDTQKMMGPFPEKKVTIDERWWSAAKLALWRSKVAWEIALKQAGELLARLEHGPDCDVGEDEPCRADCPARELRLSGLVILNAARQFAPLSAKKLADAPYIAPSREYFSEVIAELAACQAELEALTVRPTPPVTQLKEKNP